MLSNVVLVSGVQQSHSVLHIHVPILFQILFPLWLLQNVEQSSLCYIVGPCWLPILNIVKGDFQSALGFHTGLGAAECSAHLLRFFQEK